MTLEIRLRPEAEHDLADAAAWYEEQREGLGHDFLDEVLMMLSSIAETPLVYPDIHRNTRRAVIHRFPFSIYFRVESATIVVLAIMHGVEIHVAGRVAHNKRVECAHLPGGLGPRLRSATLARR